MAKTIVISEANYAANALDKVTFAGNIPCTGIELDESSYSLTDYTPVEVAYTLTPADTTDPVVWTSSDENVVTVEDGEITAVGLGTATITVSCGNFSDTATVSVSIGYIPNYVGAARSNIDPYADPQIIATSKYSKYFTAAGTGAQQTTYVSVGTNDPPIILNGIKLPKNTAKIKVSRSADKGGWFSANEHLVVFAKDEFSGNDTFPDSIKPISKEEISLKTTAEYLISVPSGADSVFISIEFSSVPSDFEDDIATTGFAIEFLAE